MTQLPLSVRELWVKYGQPKGRETAVVRGVTLEVAASDVLGIVGEGGSGKSTLLQAIVGMMPDGARVEGNIQIFGHDVTPRGSGWEHAVRHSEVSTISAGGRALLNPMARVGDQIVSVLRDRGGFSRTRARARTLELLSEVEIPDPARLARAYPHELSGGMAQRIVIAMAIACAPNLIIADEPTRGLDVTIAAEIFDLMTRLIHERGASAVIATRDFGVVAQHCSRVLVLRDGRAVEDAPVDTFFPEPTSAYSRALLAAEFGIGRPDSVTRLPSIDEAVKT